MRPPTVHQWIGSGKDVLYWDDADNWKDSLVPNGKESIAVFSRSIREDTNVLLRSDATIAQLWISEDHSLTFSADHSDDVTTQNAPKFLFETTQQFSTILMDEHNKADHVFSVWILHSCVWSGSARHLATPRLDDSEIRTIHFKEGIGNYKDPDRASLQAYGNIALELHQKNTFRGPVMAKRNGRIRVHVPGAIPDGSPIDIDGGGEMQLAEGVLIKTKDLRVNGEILEPGLYGGEESALALTKSVSPISGLGAIAVEY